MLAMARRLFVTAIAAVAGFVVSWTAGTVPYIVPKVGNFPFLAETLPLPHHVPKDPGGLSFRFAMAHDVLVERFPRHGAEYYRKRNELTRAQLATLAPDDPARFPLEDDLGVGLERLGKSDEAAAVLRAKLGRQQARGLSGRDLYTSYANLGTFLIHASAKKAIAGDKAARETFREGLEYVRKSVEVNPTAHFGRERWQIAIAEFLLAAMNEPNRLRTFDCLGNRLDLDIEQALDREANWTYLGYGRAVDAALAQGKVDAEVPAFFRPGINLEDPALWPELSPIRVHITKIGAERGWDEIPVPSHTTPVAFDEPTLGIIGMWREGGGASPHFALALGETMLRVGQRYIAWEAYERASRLAEKFWPDPTAQQFLRDHCRKRQEQIEATLLYQDEEPDRRPPWQHVSPPPPKEAVAALRPQFDKELAFGEGFQKQRQDYEAAKIAAGVPISDAHLFDEFSASHPSIASSVGPEESFVRVTRTRIAAYGARRAKALGILGAGITAITVAAIGWILRRRRNRVRNDFGA
jgi:tetratricopeptide (TPR) repeat protein